MLVPVVLLPAILPPSPPAQKPASACPTDHSRNRNSSLLGLTCEILCREYDYFLSNFCFLCINFTQ
jgi:hypothetical protein